MIMPNTVQELTLRTARRTQLIDITREVTDAVARSGVRSGLCVVYVPHTTAGTCINENADPDVRADVEAFLDKLIPEGGKPLLEKFEHNEGNSDSHIKSIITGPSVTLMIENGRLLLGRWQGIYFAEYDGPRTRNTWIKILADADA
jgi:secondary thiamine-phosphate synthase enzyme